MPTTMEAMQRLIEKFSGDRYDRESVAYELLDLASDEENRALIISAGGIELLFKLLFNYKSYVQDAARALYYLAGDDANNRWITSDNDKLDLLSHLLGNKSTLLRQKMLLGFSCCDWGDRLESKDIVRLIELLVGFLEDENIDFRVQVLSLLGDIASHYRHNKTCNECITQVGVIELLVGLLRDESEKIRAQVSSFLNVLASETKERECIAGAGGIELLIELLRDKSEKVRAEASGLLGALATEEKLKERIGRAGGIDLLVRLLADSCLKVRAKSTGALMSLAISTANRKRISKAGGVTLLVKLLKDSDATIRYRAAAALNNLAAEGIVNRDEIAQAGAISVLIGLLKDTDTSVRSIAAGALANLAAEHVVSQEKITKEGGVELLVHLLRDEQVRKHALRALVNLAQNIANKGFILKAAGVPALVLLLADTDSNLRGNAASLLDALVPSTEKQGPISSTREAMPVVRFLQDENRHIRKSATVALGKLLSERATKGLISDSELNLLVRQLGDVDADVRRSATVVFGELLSKKASRELISDSEVNVLVSLLYDLDADVRRLAVSKIMDLTRDKRDYWSNRGRLDKKVAHAKKLMIEPGRIKPLLRLLHDEDKEIRKNTIEVLKHIAKAGAIRSLLHLLKDEAADFRQYAAEALDKILSCCDAQDQFSPRGIFDTFFKKGGFELLVTLLSDASTGVRKSAAEALGKLEFFNFRDRVSGSIEGLVGLLHHLDVNVRKCSVKILDKISRYPVVNQEEIVRLRGIEPLLKLLTDECSVVREKAASVLCNLASNAVNKERIAAAGGLELLVGLLEDEHTGSREQAVRAIEELAVNAANQKEIALAGGITPLVRLLTDGKKEVRENAAGALQNMAVNAVNKKRIGDVGGLEALLRLLADEDTSIRNKAVKALANLAVTAPNQKRIVDAGGIELLLQLLKAHGRGYSNDGLKGNVLNVLKELSRNLLNQERISAAGAIEPLVQLLRDYDPIVRNNAVQVLKELSRSQANKKLIADTGGIRVLVKLLEDDAADVIKGAVQVIERLATDHSANRNRIASAGAIEPLVSFLRAKDVGFQRSGVQALQQLAVDSDSNQERIAAAGGIGPLMQLLSHRHSAIRNSAAHVLKDVASHQARKERVADEQHIRPLVRLLRNKQVDIRKSVAQALKGLAWSEGNQKRIIASGAIEPLVRLLGDKHKDIVVEAAGALWNLSWSADSKEKVALAGGIEPLLRVLGSRNTDARLYAVRALQNLAVNKANQRRIGSVGGVEKLVGLLDDEVEDIRKYAAAALKNLAMNPANKAIIEEVKVGRNEIKQKPKPKKRQQRRRRKEAKLPVPEKPANAEKLPVPEKPANAEKLPVPEKPANAEQPPVIKKPVARLPVIDCHDERIFRDTGRHRLGGSSFCSGVFEKRSDHSLWVGKCDVLSSEKSAKADACREKIASDIYAYFGIPVPPTSLARLPIILPEWAENAAELGIGADRTHTVYFLSEIIAGFQTFSAIPELKRAVELNLEVPGQGRFPVIGLGHILAVASFLNDVDVIGGAGGNIGFQVVDGQLRCFKIDPGCSFSNQETLRVADREIRVATQAPNGVIQFSDFPPRVRREFLATLVLIVKTPDAMMERFFRRAGAESLAIYGDGNFLKKTPQLLIRRKSELAVIYQEELQATPARRPDYGLEIRSVREEDIIATLQTIRHRSQAEGGGAAARLQVSVRAGGIQAARLDYDRTQPPLGSGGFADVYKGRWRGYDVAIKVLKTQAIIEAEIAELQQEGELMTQLHHPNIVRAYGVCLQPGHYSLVMHYYPGGTLYNLLRTQVTMPWPKRLRISFGVSQGLEYLHDKDVLHRDLKSLNILMNGERPVITDFGLAKIKSAITMTRTQAGGAGSIPWMAPEMFDPQGKYKLACDVYSLAMIFYEIASGEVPWQGAHVAHLIGLWVMQEKRPKMPAPLPEAFAALMTRCWSQRAADRPKADEVVRELEAMQQQGIP